MSASRSFVVLALVALVAGGSFGCATQRPTHLVRHDADAAFAEAQYDQAAIEYETIVDRSPGDWRAQYGLGRCLLEVDRPAEAREALEVAHSVQPMNDAIADALAEAMYREGSHDALFTFLTDRARARGDIKGHLQLARYAVEAGDMDTARRSILTAIEISRADSAEPYLAAASFEARLNNRSEVIRRLRQAYAINPEDDRITSRLREYGEVPGPTLGLPPGR